MLVIWANPAWQKFRIPRYVVTDDSYVDVFETENAVATAVARSSFSQKDAEASG